jgi:hypothetical protein
MGAIYMRCEPGKLAGLSRARNIYLSAKLDEWLIRSACERQVSVSAFLRVILLDAMRATSSEAAA